MYHQSGTSPACDHILARSLTLEDYGLLNVAIAASGVAVTSTTLGFPELGARDAAVHPEELRWLAGRFSLRGLRRCRRAGAGDRSCSRVALHTQWGSPWRPRRWPFDGASLEWLARGRERMSRLARAWALGGLTLHAGLLRRGIHIGECYRSPLVLCPCRGGYGHRLLESRAQTGYPATGFPRSCGCSSALMAALDLLVVIYSYYANIDTIPIAAYPVGGGGRSCTARPYRVFLS